MSGGTQEAFEAERPRLTGLAYRMLGSVVDAEDIVQDAWFRWGRATEVRAPASFLTTVVVRLCLDRLKSAQVRRETLVGTWLPEPWVGQPPPRDPVLASSMSFAVLRLLEALTPPQRAAFLLRDVFDHDYADIAAILETTAANARQLVRRARAHLADPPRFDADEQARERLYAQLTTAMTQGDLTGLLAVLADDATAYSDGGGVVQAHRTPIEGAAKIVQAYTHFAGLLPREARMEPAWVNGLPGWVTRVGDAVQAVHAVEIRDGRVVALYAVLDPAKLGRVS